MMIDKFTEQVIEMIGRIKRSRAASATATTQTQDARVTEIINGLLVSKPAKKVEYIGATKDKNESEPEVIDLQEYARSKAASVPGINKVKVIHDFILFKGRN
jgi:hypothetical protein